MPFMLCVDWYKHMGYLRCANADDRPAWNDGGKGLKAKLRWTLLRRLRRVRRGSMSESEFCMVSNVLLGGLAGYYLQTNCITFAEAEEGEKEWRLIFNRLFFRDMSTPRADLYGPTAEGGHYRRLIWSVGVAALWKCLERAMAGALGEQHSIAASSAVALSLERGRAFLISR